ncbi:SUN domain-containing protein 4 [Selaginella moellendorffii]|uniref:SUN domain-containing protein 4 n=1 Tax=Selaginella moellendorffii TaxID=88036 RepID=UPI000D1D10D1|nr:SUN domain-containing protein 4 [Selaginella moellendorffii]|eukprot:XP_024529126.1 SUN domain-containing protein 4 [Selaginella moellendorffii]
MARLPALPRVLFVILLLSRSATGLHSSITQICDGKRSRHGQSSPEAEHQILESEELYFGGLERDEAEISVELDGVEILSARTALAAAENHEKPMENTAVRKRLKKVTPISLKDYKRMVSWASGSDKWNTTIKHRLEPGGEEFNFAAASHGAQIVTSSSDGGNLLKDKYFRSPCKAKEKSFVLKLAEEVLVDTVVIENHELYSSNPRELEVLGTLSYPTENWRLLGNVEAQNICRPQRFVLPKPEWARYLKLRILSHYGNEYYCTLNHLQIFGSGLEGLIEEAQPYCELQQQDATQIHKLQEELRLLKSQMADDVLYVAIAVLVLVSAVLVYPWMGTIVCLVVIHIATS